MNIMMKAPNCRGTPIAGRSMSATQLNFSGFAAGRAATAGGLDPRLGEIYHAAPDADTRGFVDDLKDYVRVARRVTVAANKGDAALRLSAVINRGARAGRPDFGELRIPGIGGAVDAAD